MSGERRGSPMILALQRVSFVGVRGRVSARSVHASNLVAPRRCGFMWADCILERSARFVEPCYTNLGFHSFASAT